jgi:hypothetical protein
MYLDAVVFARYRKFFVALGAAVVAAGLELGVDLAPVVTHGLEFVTALAVFFVPNKP